VWEHERVIEPVPGGWILTDRVRYEPRMPTPDAVLRRLYTLVFGHRHRRLCRHFRGASRVVSTEPGLDQAT
jgi:hypothetical protein